MKVYNDSLFEGLLAVTMNAQTGTLKSRERTSRDLTTRHQVARVDIARLD